MPVHTVTVAVPFAKYNYNYEVEKDDVGGACSSNEGKRTRIDYW
jgi:hypothetical protein